MRLFGIEAHPAIAGIDLETWVCPRCDHVQTQAVPAPPRRRRKPGNRLAPGNAFDAETTRLLGAAFDAAWEAVLASGLPPVDARNAPALRDALARHVIETVRKGERSQQRLVAGSLRLLRRSPAAEIELPAE
jgi:hypothetical protein